MAVRARRQIAVDFGCGADHGQRSRAGAVVDALGFAYAIESLAEPFLHAGQAVRPLNEWSVSFEELCIYYPGHRQVPVMFALSD